MAIKQGVSSWSLFFLPLTTAIFSRKKQPGLPTVMFGGPAANE